MNFPKHLLLTLSLILVAGAGCIAPGSSTERVQSSYLPDHITEIYATTLSQAILETRQRGRESVTITDPSGNTITANISDPTHTVFTITNQPGADDPFAILEASSVPVDGIYAIVTTDDTITFNMNMVRYADIASMMYEISVRVFNIITTQDWVIDIQ